MTAAALVQMLTEFAGDCELEYEEVMDASPEMLAVVLAAVRDTRADLAVFYSVVERELMEVSGTKRFVVEGLGEVAIRKSVKRTQWDNDALAQVVVAYALDERVLDEETGEYESAFQAVARVLMECARPSWRITPLRDRGIDPDEYCSVDDAAYGVQLPSRPS